MSRQLVRQTKPILKTDAEMTHCRTAENKSRIDKIQLCVKCWKSTRCNWGYIVSALIKQNNREGVGGEMFIV